MDSLKPILRWILIVAVIFAAARTLSRNQGGPPSDAPAPAFEAKVLAQAAPFRLAEHRGRTVVLDFWATWCPPCQRTLPALQKLHEQFAGTDVDIYGVNTDDGPDREQLVAQFLKTRHYTFPVLLGTGPISQDYKVEAIPTLVIVRPDGNVETAHVGLLDNDPDAIARAVTEMIESARSRTPAG